MEAGEQGGELGAEPLALALGQIRRHADPGLEQRHGPTLAAAEAVERGRIGAAPHQGRRGVGAEAPQHLGFG